MVVRVSSGHDQTNVYTGEYAASSRTGRSCVGAAVDGIAALVGRIVVPEVKVEVSNLIQSLLT